MKLHNTLALIISSVFVFVGQAFAGEFDNHCTYGLSKHTLHKTDCSVNEIFEGKTYCFSSEGAKDAFLFDQTGMIKEASSFYETKKAEMNEDGRIKISQEEALAIIKSEQCDLSNKELGYLMFDGMDLRHCNMENTSFFGAYLRGANLSDANLKHSYLNLVRLENANLSGADLSNATIFQAIFDKTNFNGANLTNARMIGTLGAVDMRNAVIKKGRYGLDIGNQPMGAMRFDAIGGKFENSDFEGSDINRANLQFADLRNANLRNVDLFRADLSKADLTGADITGANFKESVLDGAILKNVKGLTAIVGYDIAKGKCKSCEIEAAASNSKSADSKTKIANCPISKFKEI